MKKYIFIIQILIISFMTIGCDFLLVSETTQTNQSTETATVSTTTRETPTTSTTTLITTTENVSTTLTTTDAITQTTTTQTTTISYGQGFRPSGYSLLQDELDWIGIPASGDVKVLVFAIDFSDYPSQLGDVTMADIERVFNGGSNDLSYESVQSFYDKSSFGMLHLSADVFGFYRASQPSSYYEEAYEKLWAQDPLTGEWLYGDDEVTYPESDLIYELLSYYDDAIDYNQYDANNDGYIDGIYMVYTAPVSFASGSDLWWAYQDIYIYENDTFDGVEPLYFTWAGTEFLTYGNDELDARTLIHETGHMLGLDDYYDYSDIDAYNMGGLGGADMMDSAYGDHGPFSKILLGWITPIVVETSSMVDLHSYASSGDVILLIDEWQNTIFDEYLLIWFYTPEGLYEQSDDRLMYFDVPGIAFMHVSAAIGQGYNEDLYYYSIFNHNNTDTDQKLIKYIEADLDQSIEQYDMTEDSDLFQEGDIFGEIIYENYRWYNNLPVNFRVTVLDIGEDKSSIIIDKK